MDILDYVLLAAILGLAGVALWRARKRKGCCGGCSGCPHSGTCEQEKKQEQRR